MCWFRRKNYKAHDHSVPPPAPLSKEALDVVWNDDKTAYYEIHYKNGFYIFTVMKLQYEDDIWVGYYWAPVDDRCAHFFDSPDKAAQEAYIVMRQ